MKCGEATLPERLQIQSTVVDPYLFVEISSYNNETLTLRLTSSVAFTLIMTSLYFITPTVVVVVLFVDDDDDDDENNDDEDDYSEGDEEEEEDDEDIGTDAIA